MGVSPERLAIAVNNAAFLYSHRRGVVLAAQEAGWQVSVAVPSPDPGATDEVNAIAFFRERGISVHELAYQRSTPSILEFLRAIWALRAFLRLVRPDVAHFVTPQSVICGGLAAHLTGVERVVGAISGLGYLDRSDSPTRKLIRAASRALYRVALSQRSVAVIVQNARDEDTMRRLLPRRTRIERFHGSGVDLEVFTPAPPSTGIPRVVLPSRMLRDKGIPIFARAAAQVRDSGIEAEFILAGGPDARSPSSMSEDELVALAASGHVKYLGHRTDIREILQSASIVCLPSEYGEGLPLALAEAAACGIPVVTTDMPGCRDAVDPDVTGLLVPPRDHVALAEALTTLLLDPDRRRAMGARARALAEARFGVSGIIESHLALYRWLVST